MEELLAIPLQVFTVQLIQTYRLQEIRVPFLKVLRKVNLMLFSAAKSSMTSSLNK